METHDDALHRPDLAELFVGFLQIALSSFGGAGAWARHFIVERRRWLSDAEFTEALGIAQVVPGPNVGNLAVMLGARFAGVPGVVACFSALMLVPTAVAIALDALLMRWIHVPGVAAALGGVAAAAGGLVIGTAAKMGARFRKQTAPVALAALAFAGAGPLHLGLVAVLPVLAPAALLWAWRTT